MDEDIERENRITMEIVADCYDSNEQFYGWYEYLNSNLEFPFEGVWEKSKNSKNEEITIIGMGNFDECENSLNMLVEIEYQGQTITKSLLEINEVFSDDKTKEAIEDWKYWIKSGNSFKD